MKLYTCEAVADWLALTPRRVRQLRDEGIISERMPGLFEMKPTITRYIMYLRKGSGKTDLNDERALLTRAKREAADMENELRRGTLHSSEEIEKGIRTMCLNIRTKFLTLPAKLSPRLSQMSGDQAGIFDELKSAVDEALEELSNYQTVLALVSGDEEEEADDGQE